MIDDVTLLAKRFDETHFIFGIEKCNFMHIDGN